MPKNLCRADENSLTMHFCFFLKVRVVSNSIMTAVLSHGVLSTLICDQFVRLSYRGLWFEISVEHDFFQAKHDTTLFQRRSYRLNSTWISQAMARRNTVRMTDSSSVAEVLKSSTYLASYLTCRRRASVVRVQRVNHLTGRTACRSFFIAATLTTNYFRSNLKYGVIQWNGNILQHI